MLGKKNKEKELEKAKKLIEQEEEIEQERTEQAASNPVVDAAPKPQAPQPSKAELARIKEQVEYYNEQYRGIFNPTEMPIEAMMGEIACLLFGILQELRDMK